MGVTPDKFLFCRSLGLVLKEGGWGGGVNTAAPRRWVYHSERICGWWHGPTRDTCKEQGPG